MLNLKFSENPKFWSEMKAFSRNFTILSAFYFEFSAFAQFTFIFYLIKLTKNRFVVPFAETLLFPLHSTANLVIKNN